MRLRTKVVVVMLVVLSFGAGMGGGLFWGVSIATQAEMLAEYKVCRTNLTRPHVSPQVREYLKSRVYFLACSLKPSRIQGLWTDYGPVDEKLLGELSGIKGPESHLDIYHWAVTRHAASAPR